MATVFRATDPVLKRDVAIKVMHGHLAADPAFVGRFRHEAQAVAALRHPNIVKVYDFGNEGDSYFMVMEFVDGPTLASLLGVPAGKGDAVSARRGARLSTGEILRIFLPLCSAIDYASSRGMIHRDIKPANVLITPDGEPVLTDYGIAKIMGATSLTASGTVVGSARYMSPEQVQGFPTDHRTDVYSLGVVLFEALSGRVPYDADTTASILAQHISAPVPSVLALNAELPLEVQPVMERALAKEPEGRYQHAGDLAAALYGVLTAVPTAAPGPAATPRVEPSALAATVLVRPVVPAGPDRLPAGPVAAPVTGLAPGSTPVSADGGVAGAGVKQPVEVRQSAEVWGSVPDWPGAGFDRGRRSRHKGVLMGAAVAAVVVVAVVMAVLLTRSGKEAADSTTTSVATGTTASAETEAAALREAARLIGEGDAILREGGVEEAIVRYEAALDADPDNTRAHSQLGIAYYLHGDYTYEQTQMQMMWATKGDPADAQAWAFLGLSRLGAARRDKADSSLAEEACRRAIEVDDQSGPAHGFLGRVLVYQGRDDDALVETETALGLRPDDPWVQTSAGWVNKWLGDWQAALPYDQKAVESRPVWASFILLLGEDLRELARYDEAEAHYQMVVDLDQGHRVSGYTNLGYCQWKSKDSVAAIASLKEALALDQDADAAHWAIGAIWDEQKDYSAALPHLQRAVDLEADNANYHAWLGDCLFWMERYEESRAAVDAALALSPDFEWAQQLSGSLAEKGY